MILGEPGDEALLGVVTLEIIGLVLHPFNRTLQPFRDTSQDVGALRREHPRARPVCAGSG